jgi:surfeit locus 1 family protein
MLSGGRSARPARSWLVLVAALLGVALTARLGFWQLDRARQKLDLQARITSRAELPAVLQAELAHDAAAAEAQHYRRITLRGRWLAERTVYLDNRQMNARQGFFVLTPLLLASGDAVLVQRGWSARDFNDRTRRQPLATATGEVLVPGRIAPPPSKLFALGGAESGPIRQNVDLAALAGEIGVALRPLSVQQTAEARPADADADASAPDGPDAAAGDGLLRQWPVPTLDVGKHHGYAFQWFALCALITGLAVWFQLLRPRLARRPDVRSL